MITCKSRNRFGCSPIFHVLMLVLVAAAPGSAQVSSPRVGGLRELTNNLAQCDAQLAEWDAKIAKEQDPIIRTYRRNNKAMCAWGRMKTGSA